MGLPGAAANRPVVLRTEMGDGAGSKVGSLCTLAKEAAIST